MDAGNAHAKRKKKLISLSSTLVIICYLFFCDAVNFYHPSELTSSHVYSLTDVILCLYLINMHTSNPIFIPSLSSQEVNTIFNLFTIYEFVCKHELFKGMCLL